MYDHMNLLVNIWDLVDKWILKLIYEREIICRVVDNAYLVDYFENNFIYDHVHTLTYMWDLVDNSAMKLIYECVIIRIIVDNSELGD